MSRLSWSPDGREIYFTAPEPKTPKQKERDKAKDDVFAYDENYEEGHLWRVVVAAGQETRLTSGDFNVAEYQLSPDGTRIALHRMPNPLLGASDRGEFSVRYLLILEGNQCLQNRFAGSRSMMSICSSR